MSLYRKGAFETHPALARRVAIKRFFARLVLFAERLAPKLLAPLSILALFFSFAWFGLFRHCRILRVGQRCSFSSSLFSHPSSRWCVLRWPAAADADRLLEKRNHLPHQPVGVQEDEPAFDTPFARALWKNIRSAWLSALRGWMPVCRDLTLPATIAMPCAPFPPCWSCGFRLFLFEWRRLDWRCVSPSAPPAKTASDLRIDAWLTPPAYTGRAHDFPDRQPVNFAR